MQMLDVRAMTDVLACPHCGAKIQTKVLADSDYRIYAQWPYCEDCGWDERSNCSRHPQRLSPAEMTGGDSGTPENGAAE